MSRLLLSEDGHLWVEHYPRPNEPRQWYVFDPEGQLVRAVELPARAEIQDAGAEWVLLKLVDERGVESLAVYELVEEDP